MRAAEWIEWGRAPRGRVWHILAPFGGVGDVSVRQDAALCSLEHQIVEATRGLPPRGAKVCSECRHRVADLHRVLRLADDDGVVDAEIADDECSACGADGRQLGDGHRCLEDAGPAPFETINGRPVVDVAPL